MLYDVIVVGAGPMGLYIGEQLASSGYDVLILEENGDIGNPSHCAGLFSTHVFDIVGNIGILHPAKKARIYAPNRDYIDIGNDKTRGYVVDRVLFDRELAKRAVNRGANLQLKERVKKVKYPEVIAFSRYKGRIIVGADGLNSVVRRSIGVKAPKIIGAMQTLVRYEAEDIEKVYIFLGNSVAKGFFAWLIPLDENFAKVGLASYHAPWDSLKNLLKKLNLKPLSIVGWGIPIGWVDRSYDNGIILVGDAASQVKATSGGGVYPGLRCAQCAVKIIERALEAGAHSSSFLSSYEKCWKSGIGRELRRTLMLHKIYRKIRDEEFNGIIRELKDEKLIRVINEEGDIDYPSRVVFKILKRKPSLLKYLSIPAKPYHIQI